MAAARSQFDHVDPARLQEIVGERLGEPLALGWRREEGGVVHAERREDPLGEELAEALPRDDLDDAAEHVGRMAVFPNALAG